MGSGEPEAESLCDRVSDCEGPLVTRCSQDRADSYCSRVASSSGGFATCRFGGGRSGGHGAKPLGEEARARVLGFVAEEERGSLPGGRGPRFLFRFVLF